MLLAIFLIIFSAIALRNIRYGVYLIIFSMPLYLWRFSVLGIPSTALEVMIYILFLVWIINKLGLSALISRNYADSTQKNAERKNAETLKLSKDKPALPLKQIKPKSKLQFHRLVYETIKPVSNRKLFRGDDFVLNIGIILLFLGATISTALSSDIKTSLGILKGWFFDPFLFFIVFVNVIKTKKEICLALKSWLASGVAVSLIGIFYLLNNNLTFDGRLKAFFLSPNHLAMYLSPAFLILLFFTLNKKVFGIWYLVFGIFLLTVLIPLYFTYSFGAFLGLFAGIIYLLLAENKCGASLPFLPLPDALFLLRGFSRRLQSFSFANLQRNTLRLKPLNPQLKLGRIQNPISRLLIIILLFLAFTSFLFITLNKFNQIIDSHDRSSFHSRLMIWSSAGEIIKDNPIFGIGPGTFQETYLSYADKFSEPYLEWAVPQPHNIFLAFYLQTGLIGFAGFILVLIWFFQNRRHRAPNGINNIPLSTFHFSLFTFLTSLMIYTLVHGLVDTTYWKNDLSLMFWLIIGLGLISFKMYARPASSDKDRGNFKTK